MIDSTQSTSALAHKGLTGLGEASIAGSIPSLVIPKAAAATEQRERSTSQETVEQDQIEGLVSIDV